MNQAEIPSRRELRIVALQEANKVKTEKFLPEGVDDTLERAQKYYDFLVAVDPQDS